MPLQPRILTLADGTKLSVASGGDTEGGPDFDYGAAMNAAGYVTTPNQNTIDYFNQTYGTDFDSPEQYLQSRYGGGQLAPQTDPRLAGQQWFQTPKGVDQFTNAPLNYNKQGGFLEENAWMIPLMIAGAGLTFGGAATGAGAINGATGGVGDFYGSLAENAGIGSTATDVIAAPGFGSAVSGAATGGMGGGMTDLMELLKKAGILPGSGGTLGSIANIGRGLYGLYQGSEMKDLAAKASQQENPFGPYRAQYANMLSALYSNPSSITKMPGYEAGLDAVTRKMASQGYLGSGNMMTALQKYGGDFFNAEADRLATLAGAKFAPGGGSQLLQGNVAGTQLQGNSLNSLIYGALGMMGGNSSPNDLAAQLRRAGIIMN